MFIGWSRNISSYIPQCHVTDEHNLYSLAPMSVQSYIRQDIFISYVSWLTHEHKLYSTAINICFSVFGR
jgi:hypothetical protein